MFYQPVADWPGMELKEDGCIDFNKFYRQYPKRIRNRIGEADCGCDVDSLYLERENGMSGYKCISSVACCLVDSKSNCQLQGKGKKKVKNCSSRDSNPGLQMFLGIQCFPMGVWRAKPLHYLSLYLFSRNFHTTL